MGNCLCQQPPVPAVPVPVPVPAVSVLEEIKTSFEGIKTSFEGRARALSASDWYQNITYENTPEYTLEGLRRKVKILRILDGDTVDIALHHEETNRIFRHRVRLYGIDTPEKRPSRSDPERHLEIAASLRSKHALEQRSLENDHIVLAVFYHPDKYGRLLCTFYDKHGENMNEWMVKQGHATEYFGKTKKKFQAISFSQEETI